MDTRLKQETSQTPHPISLPGMPDIPLFLHTSGDLWISDHIRAGHVFEPHIVTLLRSLVSSGASVADVGANIGYTACVAAVCAGPSGHVHAFEPEPANLALLEQNAASAAGAPVSIHPYAAGATNTKQGLSLSGENSGDHRLESVVEGRNVIPVDVKRLDAEESLGGASVDVLKIDTQGAEVDVLDGFAGCLEANPHVRIIAEFWPYGLKRCGRAVDELFDILQQRDVSVWLVSHQHSCERVSFERLAELARTSMAPGTEAHADIVVLSAHDTKGHAVMDGLCEDWSSALTRLSGFESSKLTSRLRTLPGRVRRALVG